MVSSRRTGRQPCEEAPMRRNLLRVKCFLLCGVLLCITGDILKYQLLPESVAASRHSFAFSPTWRPQLHKGFQLSLENSYSGPYIDASLPTNISAQVNGHAYIPCAVKRLGSRSVSWIRKSDGYLLTVDRDTFIADNRFQALHVVSSDVWTLHIRNVKPDDATSYECQVSSEPKISQIFNLDVITPKVEIRGAPDIYVKSGSRVELQCILTKVLEEPPFIFWYYRGKRITVDDSSLDLPTGTYSFHKQRRHVGHLDQEENAVAYGDDDYDTNHQIYDDVSIEETLGKKTLKPGVKSTVIVRVQPGTIVSLLSITSSTIDDEGVYECRPSNMPSASVTLHVLNGEHEEPAAAIQDSSHSSVASRTASVIAVAVAVCIFLW